MAAAKMARKNRLVSLFDDPRTCSPIVPACRSRPSGKGDCAEQRVGGLPGIESGMLDHDRYVGLDDTGVVCVAGNRLGILQVVESQLLSAPCRHNHGIWPGRLTG